MRVTGLWAAVSAVIVGLILADLLTHPKGTKTITNGIVGLEKNTGNALAGK